ncbi:tripartite motif-containing protein 3 [Drosophila kikkawai]|uniref:Tripartite motif-containing protein 3 n=1 Tax=Drosophila kikkawai TaxID=30033 RepID=A0A6P4HY11_DROKI|nr:E3 ubiquitin-protein ligase rnf168 [Drosophila kikkawai]
MPGPVEDENEDLAESEDLCAFCLDRIQNPERLHCNHAFCKTCLEIYLEERNWVAKSCPICRRSLGEPWARQGNAVRDFRGPGKYIIGWRLFGCMTLAIMLLSLVSFYLLLIYW